MGYEPPTTIRSCVIGEYAMKVVRLHRLARGNQIRVLTHVIAGRANRERPILPLRIPLWKARHFCTEGLVNLHKKW